MKTKTLDPITGQAIARRRWTRWILISAPLVIVPIGVFLLLWIGGQEKEQLPEGKPQAREILSIHGSNTLGASLLPMLAERFLRQRGALEIKRITSASDVDVIIAGIMPPSEDDLHIDIQAHGSSTGFKDLAAKTCDIAASSRKIKPEEAAQLKRLGLGNMTALTNEHVVGLDGVAIIVNQQNPVDRLSIEQVARIFTGEIENWSEVGGLDQRISVYARDEKSGTYDTFRSLVLGKNRGVSNWALRFEDSLKMYQMIINEPSAIGFIGLPYIMSAKPLAIGDDKSNAFPPTYLTIKAESYALARRLYLYTAEESENEIVNEFLTFCLSDDGQRLVREAHLVDLSIKAFEPLAQNFSAPDAYNALIEDAEFVVSVRFTKDLDRLDNRARIDLERFMNFMREPQNEGRGVILVGHTNNSGSQASNLRLSEQHAIVISKILQEAGIEVQSVHGFGEKVPVASDQTPQGRERNPRVEIFLGE